MELTALRLEYELSDEREGQRPSGMRGVAISVVNYISIFSNIISLFVEPDFSYSILLLLYFQFSLCFVLQNLGERFEGVKVYVYVYHYV